jgi:anthranilate phosphoribosyltransferase
VSDLALANHVIGVLQARGAPRAMVVHGDDGLDELTVTATSTVLELREGAVERYSVDPAALGLAVTDADAMPGGDPATNARLAHELLQGGEGPVRDVVALNAAAGLVVAGVVDDLAAGLEAARGALDSGRAKTALDTLVSVSASVAS